MVKKTFSIMVVIVVLGAAFLEKGNAQTSTGVVRVVEHKLPEAEIMATGIGYPPKQKRSDAQKRALAQRAATIDAYRILTAVVGGLSDYVINGSGYVQISGYIKGAAITQVREFADGKVEVDLSLPVSLRGNKTKWDKSIEDISRKGYPVYYLKRPKRHITEEEWLERIKNKP